MVPVHCAEIQEEAGNSMASLCLGILVPVTHTSLCQFKSSSQQDEYFPLAKKKKK